MQRIMEENLSKRNSINEIVECESCLIDCKIVNGLVYTTVGSTLEDMDEKNEKIKAIWKLGYCAYMHYEYFGVCTEIKPVVKNIQFLFNLYETIADCDEGEKKDMINKLRIFMDEHCIFELPENKE